MTLVCLQLGHGCWNMWKSALSGGKPCAVQVNKEKEVQLAGALERATAAEEMAAKHASDIQRTSQVISKLEADKVCGPSAQLLPSSTRAGHGGV